MESTDRCGDEQFNLSGRDCAKRTYLRFENIPSAPNHFRETALGEMAITVKEWLVNVANNEQQLQHLEQRWYTFQQRCSFLSTLLTDPA